jgi:hypothetical protein
VRRPQCASFRDSTPYSSCCKRNTAVIQYKIIILRFARGCILRLLGLLSLSGAEDDMARLQNRNIIIVPVVELSWANETVQQG